MDVLFSQLKVGSDDAAQMRGCTVAVITKLLSMEDKLTQPPPTATAISIPASIWAAGMAAAAKSNMAGEADKAPNTEERKRAMFERLMGMKAPAAVAKAATQDAGLAMPVELPSKKGSNNPPRAMTDPKALFEKEKPKKQKVNIYYAYRYHFKIHTLICMNPINYRTMHTGTVSMHPTPIRRIPRARKGVRRPLRTTGQRAQAPCRCRLSGTDLSGNAWSTKQWASVHTLYDSPGLEKGDKDDTGTLTRERPLGTRKYVNACALITNNVASVISTIIIASAAAAAAAIIASILAIWSRPVLARKQRHRPFTIGGTKAASPNPYEERTIDPARTAGRTRVYLHQRRLRL